VTSEPALYLAGGVYAVAHLAPQARGAAVLVAPFAEEKKAAQRGLVEAARALATAGWDTLRFDLRGTGDSALPHGDVDLDTWLADVRQAVALQRARYPQLPLALIGLRLGAALAALVAIEEPVEQLVLWEPVVSGAAYMRQNRQRSQIRAELTTGEAAGAAAPREMPFTAFDFDGFAIGEALHAGLAGLDLMASPPPGAQRALLMQISGSSRLKKPFEDLRAHWNDAGVATDLHHVAVEAFWSAIGLVDTAPVRDETVAWLKPADAAVATASVPPNAADAPAEPLDLVSGEQTCRGLLYRPVQPPRRAVILLHGWSGYRVGPGHLLTKAARALADAGYAAYSFDFRGRGDSEWEVGSASLNSMIRDAVRAVPLVAEATGAEHITLLGLCSGGEVAIGASLGDARIDSLALWSAPIFSGNFDFARRARRGRKMLSEYWRKLWRRETWAKLFGGRLNARLILRAVSGGRSAEDAAVQDKAPDTDSQMKAFAAFRGALLFVYGGSDPETPPSRDFYRAFVEREGLAHTFVEIAGANHNYYALTWHAEVIAHTLTFLSAQGETGTPQ
jgi:exosortase A-associated hydrolase 2